MSAQHDWESPAEYAARHRARDLDPTARAERAKGLIPEWVLDGVAIQTEGFAISGLVKRVEQLEKEDSEQRSALRRVSDLEWELA